MQQPFFSRLYTRYGEFGGGLAYPNPTYTGIRGRRLAVSGETNLTYRHPWSAAGTFTNLFVRIDNSGDGHGGAVPPLAFSKDVTYTVVINGIDTPLVATIKAGQTSGSDTAHTAVVSPGQTFWIRVDAVGGANPFGEFNQFDTHLSLTFNGGTGVSGYARNANGGTIAASGGYSSPFGHSSQPFELAPLPNPANPQLYNYVAASGTLTRFDVIIDTAPGAGASWNFTVIKNGVAQDGSGGTVDTRFSISDPATTGVGTFSLHCNAGDWITLRALSTNAPATTAISYSCAFTADVDGQFNLCSSVGTPSISAPSHMGTTYWSGWDTNGYPDVLQESDLMVDVGLLPFQIAGLIVWVEGSHGGPPAQFTYNARKNQANFGSSVVLTNQTNGQINFSAIGYAAHDNFSFLALPASSPTGRNLAWTFLLLNPPVVPLPSQGSMVGPVDNQWRLHRFDLKPDKQEHL